MKNSARVHVITGSSSGIGRATRELLTARGHVVYGLDIVGDGDPRSMACDVRDPASIIRGIRTVVEREGRIDGLFANAGKHHVATLEDTSDEVLDELIAINVKGVFHTLRAAIPFMKAQGGGAIVLMGSDQCFVGKGSSSVYGLTKGAIGQLAKSTAIDLAPFNIRVNCICPGSIDTPLLHRAVEQFTGAVGKSREEVMAFVEKAQPIARLGRPEEIASAVAYMLSDEASFMTGALMSVDGGYVCQ